MVERLRTLLGVPPFIAKATPAPGPSSNVEAESEPIEGDASADESPTGSDQDAAPRERTPLERLVDRLAQGGLELQSFEAPVDIALRGVRGGRPVVTVGGDGVVWLLLQRLGPRVRVEDEQGRREWLDPRQLAARLGLAGTTSEHTWLAVDASPAVPLDPHAEGSPWRLAYDLVRADLLALLLAAGLVFAAVLRAMQASVVEVVQRRLFVRVVSQLAHSLPRVSAQAFKARRGTALLNRFFDLFMAQKAIASLALGGIEAVLAGVVGLVLLGVYPRPR